MKGHQARGHTRRTSGCETEGSAGKHKEINGAGRVRNKEGEPGAARRRNYARDPPPRLRSGDPLEDTEREGGGAVTVSGRNGSSEDPDGREGETGPLVRRDGDSPLPLPLPATIFVGENWGAEL
eukprot:scaffold91132_cov32-Tisochrysis_lutea.AAC.1